MLIQVKLVCELSVFNNIKFTRRSHPTPFKSPTSANIVKSSMVSRNQSTFKVRRPTSISAKLRDAPFVSSAIQFYIKQREKVPYSSVILMHAKALDIPSQAMSCRAKTQSYYTTSEQWTFPPDYEDKKKKRYGIAESKPGRKKENEALPSCYCLCPS